MSLNRIIIGGLLASIALCPLARSQNANEPMKPKDLVAAPVATPASTNPAGATADAAGIKNAAQQANVFGAKVLDRLLGRGTATTVVVSPYSINSALDLLTLGAAGHTATVLTARRGIPPSKKALAEQQALNHALSAASTPDVVLQMANSVWLKPGALALPAYVSAIHDGYGATVTNVDFASPATTGVVNDWVKQNTQNVIERIVDKLEPTTEFLLVNTTYFKGKWAIPFDKAETRPAPFTRADGSKHDVPMMAATTRLGYAETPRWHAVAIPYRGDRFEMIVVTAKNPAQTIAVQHELQSTGFVQALHGIKFAAHEIELRLPRFRAEYGSDLTDVLTRLGLGPAFGSSSDYRKLTATRLQSARVVHRAVVAVDEEGTEAAAATAVIGTRSAVAAQPVQFVVDRPFAFGIVDRLTGAVLFIGYVADPTA